MNAAACWGYRFSAIFSIDYAYDYICRSKCRRVHAKVVWSMDKAKVNYFRIFESACLLVLIDG